MRLRRSRLEEFFHKKMTVKKDKEGSTSEEYGAASSVTGESWPASGKVQAEQYGQRLNYIRNVRISGKYEVKPDEKGRMHYILENGTDIQESDGICLFVGKDAVPDYRIISIKPYRMLSLEVEKL
nr:MAG TPA: head closure knob [Caudoviricetes sp.]